MITVYEAATGRIQYVVDADPPAIQATKENLSDPWVEGNFHWDTHYISDGQGVLRPECPAQLDGLVLTNVPVPASIQINSATYETNESTVELSFNHPGTYRIVIKAFPYLDKEFQIENPA